MEQTRPIEDTISERVLENPCSDELNKEFRSSARYKFIFISSQKGVGKTSAIANLAVALSKRKMKVGILDVNFHAPDIHKMFGLKSPFVSRSDKRFIPQDYSAYLKMASIGTVLLAREETGAWGKRLEIHDIQRFIDTVCWGDLDYLLIDTPPGAGQGLLTVIHAIPDAQIIIVTAPNRICSDRAKKMISFLNTEKIPISGWIENMQGLLCQNWNKRQELFSTGSASRAIFLMEIPFLGKIPSDLYMKDTINSGEVFME